MTSTISATVIPHQDLLLNEARELHTAGKYSLAVLVAHMACEVVTSRVIDAAFAKSTFSHMAKPMLEFLNGYNLANRRIREFYASLTGDDVTQVPLWSKFCESASRRNGVAHAGEMVSREEGEESLAATGEFISHMNTVLSTLRVVFGAAHSRVS